VKAYIGTFMVAELAELAQVRMIVAPLRHNARDGFEVVDQKEKSEPCSA
jgi:hypothetical protein